LRPRLRYVMGPPGDNDEVHEPDFLTRTREGYDRTAQDYAEAFHHYLDDKPVDVAMLSAFAGLIMQGANRRVLDVGCGTGATTTLLAQSGVAASGIDLSPNMIAAARRLAPGLPWRVGSMTALDAADGSVGGVCAWYSIIHVPDSHLPGVLGEFHRVLEPNGLVLLAFQAGDTPRVLDRTFGQPVALTFVRRQPQCLTDLLADNGFALTASLVREPVGEETTRQAFLIARKVQLASVVR
jgi:ubiquinone/menaquinone biosynthesis C-methylase UbiE